MTKKDKYKHPVFEKTDDISEAQKHKTTQPVGEESGGPKGPEPTRYGDWETSGRCTDF